MIVVTGGSGFIGSNLLSYLVAGGNRQILSVDKREPPFRLDGVEYVNADISIEVPATRLGPGSIIYHLAAEAGVNCTDPVQQARSNIIGTINVARLAQRHGAHLVFASSCAVDAMGDAAGDGPTSYRWSSGYGASKLAAEAYLQTMAAREQLSATILRFSNVYGWQPEPKSVVSEFILACMNGRPMTIAGNGLQSRDFIHVYDVATMMVRAAANRYIGPPLHLCSGRQTTIRRLAMLVSEMVGGENLQPQFEDRFTGIDLLDVRPHRLEAEFGVRMPSVDLRLGIESVVAYLRDYTAGRNPSIKQIWDLILQPGSGWPRKRS